MALVTERIATIREGWLTVDVTYDDVTLVVESFVAVNSSPYTITAELLLMKNNNLETLRQVALPAGQTMNESKPFGGGFKNLDDLRGQSYSWDSDA